MSSTSVKRRLIIFFSNMSGSGVPKWLLFLSITGKTGNRLGNINYGLISGVHIHEIRLSVPSKDYPIFSQILYQIGLVSPGEGALPNIGQTGMCGLYGWVFLYSKICRNGCILESVHMGLTKFIRNRHEMVKDCQ